MKRKEKIILWGLVLLNITFFLLFIPSNFSASRNIEMVTVFEPDEGVPLPYVFNMIRPADNLKSALINFAFYKYYFYGFPYFAYSALLLIPLSFASRLNEIPLVMVILRQMVSVLPMLLSINFLVYMQTRFKDYRAIFLFIFLVSIPAVFYNNLWWHPDGLAILFAILTIFFLNKDDFNFGRSFFFAGAMCGFSAGTKGIGFYFFLTIITYLLIGLINNKVNSKRFILSALLFILVMAGAYLLANPILIYQGVRADYFQVMAEESKMLFQGYQIAYPKGVQTVIPQLTEDYASIPFLISLLGINFWGIFHGDKRLLNILIFTWVLPTTIFVFYIIHYKFQYMLPVALPLFSSVIILLPEKINIKSNFRTTRTSAILGIIGIGLILNQTIFNARRDIQTYSTELNREENSSSITFYEKAVEALGPLPKNQNLHILTDVRIYLPKNQKWNIEAQFDLMDYDLLAEKRFDVLLIMQQRILDYLDPDSVGLNEEEFVKNKIFYKDARAGYIEGYKMLFKDKFGIVFLSDALYHQYF